MPNNVAIITGAGRGIGRAIARELALRGYSLTLTARTPSDLDETARLISLPPVPPPAERDTLPPSSIHHSPSSPLILPGDISNPAHIDHLVSQTLHHFGRIDAIINNAGYAPSRSIEDLTLDEWHKLLDTNLSAAFYLIKASWPIFRARKAGVIVNISSESARDPFPGLAAYGAAKAALNLLGWALAREGAAHNIRLHTIAPAAVETEMLRALVPHEQYPTEKTLSPDDVARAVAGCITGDLQYTSGEVIYLHKTP